MFGQQAFGSPYGSPYTNKPLQSLSPESSSPYTYKPYNFHAGGGDSTKPSTNIFNDKNFFYGQQSQSPPKQNENNLGLSLNFGNNNSYHRENPQQGGQVSFARNFKARLYGADPRIQKQKQKKQVQYREELARQMKQVQDRKRKYKQKIEAQDIKFQQEFMKQQEIYAHRDGKAGRKQQPNNVIMVRTAQRNRNKALKKGVQDEKSIDKGKKGQQRMIDNFLDGGQDRHKISKRAYNNNNRINYHNNDNPNLQGANSRARQSQIQKLQQKQLQEKLLRQKTYEQQRISKIMAFQDHMMKKLQDLRGQIRNTGSSLQSDTMKELEGIRLKIRAKPLVMTGIDKETRGMGFFDLPGYKKPELLPHQMMNGNGQGRQSQGYGNGQSFDLKRRNPLGGNKYSNGGNSRVNRSLIGRSSNSNRDNQYGYDKSRVIHQRSRQSEQNGEQNNYAQNNDVHLPGISRKSRDQERSSMGIGMEEQYSHDNDNYNQDDERRQGRFGTNDMGGQQQQEQEQEL